MLITITSPFEARLSCPHPLQAKFPIIAMILLPADMRKVYGVVVDKRDHLQRKDGGGYSDEDFAANPHDYTPLFPEKVGPIKTVNKRPAAAST